MQIRALHSIPNKIRRAGKHAQLILQADFAAHIERVGLAS